MAKACSEGTFWQLRAPGQPTNRSPTFGSPSVKSSDGQFLQRILCYRKADRYTEYGHLDDCNVLFISVPLAEIEFAFPTSHHLQPPRCRFDDTQPSNSAQSVSKTATVHRIGLTLSGPGKSKLTMASNTKDARMTGGPLNCVVNQQPRQLS